MIVTSLALLLVAGGFLIAGIAKSSVALLMVSLLVTVGASATLLLVVGAARRLAPSVATPGGPGLPASTQGVVYIPVQLASISAAPTNPVVAPPAVAPPVVGYDDMTAEQVARLVSSGVLAEEQLLVLRDYETANAKRRTVLAKVERALS